MTNVKYKQGGNTIQIFCFCQAFLKAEVGIIHMSQVCLPAELCFGRHRVIRLS
jgi:hypothetical protein